MGIYIYLRSGKHYKCVPQIRLTRSKNGATGTAILELNLDRINASNHKEDPIYNVGLQKENCFRMADICHFIWSSGKPIRLIAVFLFSTIEEKQDFFNYYPYYALDNDLEFLPAQQQEKTPNLE